MRQRGEELVLDAVRLLRLAARVLLAHQQLGPLLLGRLAHQDLPLQLLVRDLLDRVLDRPLQLLARDRALEQVVLGAALHGLDGHRLAPLAGQDDHRDRMSKPARNSTPSRSGSR